MNEKTSQTYYDYTRLLNYQSKSANGALEGDLKSLESMLPSSLNIEFSKYKQFSRTLLESGISFNESANLGPNNVLSKLLSLSQTQGANRALIIAKFLNQCSESQKVAKTLLFSLKSNFSYIAALAVVSVIAFSIIVTKVLPQFSELYNSLGSELPEFTVLAMSLSEYAVVGLIHFCLLLAMVLLTIRAIKKSLTQLSPLPSWLVKIFNNSHSGNYHHYLYLQYLKILVFAGVHYQSAKSIADQIAHKTLEKEGSIMRKQSLLDVAYKLNALDKELDYQLEDYKDSLALQLVAFRRILSTSIMAFLGVIIGGCLVAVYLPIFGMGSVI